MNMEMRFDDFAAALKVLDGKLADTGTSIEIKAIGGFALLYHDIRKYGYTVDIDTVTHDYDKDVLETIEGVAKDLELPPDWLNNYNVFENDPDLVEMMLHAEWREDERIELNNIKLYVATLDTLFMSKAIASEDAHETKRMQDIPDLSDLIKVMGITSIDQVDKRFPDIKDFYPRSFEIIRKIIETQKGS